VDGLDIEQTAQLLRTSWRQTRQALLAGAYRPQPVRRVMIPKPDGSQRELGIPTVLDRLIQQALLQVLQPLIDPTFSEHSHGFRPGRRAHEAVEAARAYVQSGKRVVVDVDLAKFFDRVNHDILIDRLRKRIDDAGVIRLVRAYLNAGVRDGGVVVDRHLGTPQGGLLSPLLPETPMGSRARASGQKSVQRPHRDPPGKSAWCGGADTEPISCRARSASELVQCVQRLLRGAQPLRLGSLCACNCSKRGVARAVGVA